MIPIPIPDNIAVADGAVDLTVPGTLRRVVISPPDGDLTGDIRPVEALVGLDPAHGTVVTLLIALEDGDLQRLREMAKDDGTPAVWHSMYTNQIPAFAVEIADGAG